MDFAVYDAEADTSLTLRLTGIVINRHTCSNPVMAIANYLFDTLRHDAFRLVDQQLQEALITCWSEQKHEPDLNDPELIKRIKHRWQYREIANITEYFTGVQSDITPILQRIQVRAGTTLHHGCCANHDEHLLAH